MMAKAKSKYPTSFNTYKEFREIFDSIPKENCMEWAENLDPNLIQVVYPERVRIQVFSTFHTVFLRDGVKYIQKLLIIF